MESGGPTFFPVGLGVEALVVKYSVLYQNKERTTRIDVTPGPAMQKYIGEGRASEWRITAIGSSKKREGP